MLEYGIKTITTNPTLITKSSEIIKLVDSRNHQTRAFVLPAEYEPLIKKLEKEIEMKKWLMEKKALLGNVAQTSEFDDIMDIGMQSIGEYLQGE
jgi:transaldolase